jgi:hypothetical protein
VSAKVLSGVLDLHARNQTVAELKAIIASVA